MCSENKEKAGDDVTSNNIINLKSYITNMDKFLVCRSCEQEEDLKIIREDEKHK